MYPCWFTKEIINMLKLKEYHRKRQKYFESSIIRYKELRKTSKAMITESYKLYILESERNINGNPKSFWNFIKSKKRNISTHHYMTFNGVSLTTNKDIADAFANYFQSVYAQPVPCIVSEPVSLETSYCLSINNIDENEYRQAVKKLKPSKSSGPDGMPPYLLKGCAEVLAFPLCFIYNLILKTQIFPDLWKVCRICPIYKSGDSTKIENFRPISIICATAKVFEQILYARIMNHVKPYITEYQHGFYPKRSVSTNLVTFIQCISDALSKHLYVDTIYTDFAKAFDKIDHFVLLNKLSSFGFSAQLLKLISSYLVCRKQFVTFNQIQSFMFNITSGVPQGSNLGPLFFLLFINDLPRVIKFSKCLLFADDLKLYKEIQGHDDVIKLQMDLDNCYNWGIKNKLFFNIKKCCVITFFRNKNITMYDYKINGEKLQRCTSVRDLGVYMNYNLSFAVHIEKLANDAYKSLGFIMRNSRELSNIQSLMLLFNALVRSKMEYACVIWSPFYQSHINKLEKIQNKFLRYLYYKKYNRSSYFERISYKNLLFEFNYVSLGTRREIMQQVFLYKSVNGILDNAEFLSGLQFNVKKSDLRVRQAFYRYRFNTLIQKYSPRLRMCDSHNNIIMKGIDIDFAMPLSKFILCLKNVLIE